MSVFQPIGHKQSTVYIPRIDTLCDRVLQQISTVNLKETAVFSQCNMTLAERGQRGEKQKVVWIHPFKAQSLPIHKNQKLRMKICPVHMKGGWPQ